MLVPAGLEDKKLLLESRTCLPAQDVGSNKQKSPQVIVTSSRFRGVAMRLPHILHPLYRWMRDVSDREAILTI